MTEWYDYLNPLTWVSDLFGKDAEVEIIVVIVAGLAIYIAIDKGLNDLIPF